MATFKSLLTPAKEEPAPLVTGLRASAVSTPQADYPAAQPETGTFSQMVGEKEPTGLRAQPVAAPRTVLGTAKDVGIDLLKGAISVPEAFVGLADIPTGGRVGRGLESIGFKPAEAKEILTEQLSPARKAAGERFAQAEGFIDKTVAAVANPSVIASAVLESLPLMGAGGAIARGVPLLGAGARALSGVARGAIGEGVIAAGSAAEGVRQQTEDELLTPEQATLAGLSGALTGAFTLLGGKVAAKLGIADVDTFLAGASQETKKKLARRTVEGFVSEGVLEELPQSIQEQVLQNVSLNRPALEGVDEAAALGLLSGGIMGGGFSAAQGAGAQGVRKQAVDEQATSTLQEQFPDHVITVDGANATVISQSGESTTLPALKLAEAALAGTPAEEVLAQAAVEALRTPVTPTPDVAAEGLPPAVDDAIAPPAEVVAPTEQAPERASIQDALDVLPVVEEGATREVFTIPSPALKGNTFIESTAPDGAKTLLVVRPDGEITTPQAGEVKVVDSQVHTLVGEQEVTTPPVTDQEPPALSIKADELLSNTVTRAQFGELVATGNVEETVKHVTEAVELHGAAVTQDAVRNEIVAQTAKVPKADRPAFVEKMKAIEAAVAPVLDTTVPPATAERDELLTLNDTAIAATPQELTDARTGLVAGRREEALAKGSTDFSQETEINTLIAESPLAARVGVAYDGRRTIDGKHQVTINKGYLAGLTTSLDFTEDGKIDEKSLETIVDKHLQANKDEIVLASALGQVMLKFERFAYSQEELGNIDTEVANAIEINERGVAETAEEVQLTGQRVTDADIQGVTGARPSPAGDQRQPAAADAVETPKLAEGVATATSDNTVEKLNAKVADLLTKQGMAKLKVNVVQTVADLAKGLRLFTSLEGNIEGAFNPKTKEIFLVADNVSDEKAWSTALHEITHSVKNTGGWEAVFGKNSDGIMKAVDAALERGDAAWKAAEQKAIDANTPAKNMREETITYFLANNANAEQALWQRIVNAIRAFLVDAGVKGDISNADIVALAERAAQQAARGTEQAVVDAVNEFAQDAGIRLSKATESIKQNHAFVKWFGDSTVVDENGEPLVVYHGTSQVFTTFDTTDRLVFFSDDPTIASEYAGDRPFRGAEGGPNIIPAHVKIENPFIITKDADGRKLAAIADIEYNSDYFNMLDNAGVVRDALSKEGYDGVVFPDTTGTTEHDSYAVFSPTQIKSVYNQGTFSETDPNILFSAEQVKNDPVKTLATMSVQTKKELQNIVARGKQALAGDTLAVQHAPKWLSVTPRSTLVELFKGRMPLITQYDKQFDTFVAARNAEVESAGINHDNAVKAAKAGTGVDQLQETAALGSYYQMTPWLPMNEQDWVPAGASVAVAQKAWKAAGMQKATGKTFPAAYAESAAAYNKMSKDTQEAYQIMVGDVAAIRKREKDAMQKIIEQSTEGDPTARAEMLGRLEEAFIGLKGAYLPLYRYGDFSLTYNDPDTGNRAVEFFTTAAARKEQMRSLQLENPETTEEEFGFQRTVREDLPKVTSSVPGSFMEQLSNTVRAQYVEGLTPDDDAYDSKVAQADQVVRDMTQVWLRWQPETSALKNSLQRKSTAGFSRDMLRGYLRYMQTHGGNVSFLENGRPIETTLDDIAASIKEQKDSGVDVSLDQSILTDLRNRYAATRTVAVGGFASAVSRLGTFWYMTSPSIFLVQLSQIGVLTFPQLATKYSIRKASKALTKSMGQAFSPKFNRAAMMEDVVVQTVYEDIMATVTPEDRGKQKWAGAELGSAKFNQGELLSSIRALNPHQKQMLALRVSMARNVLDISLTHEVNELVQGKDPNSKTAKTLKASMVFMRHGELASRKAAVLATFELAIEDGKNFFEAMDEVVDVAKSTLYDYSREGKGVLLQGDIARVVMQFQHFRIMSLFKLGLLAKDTIKGDTAARQELVGIMGMSAILSGTMGLPMAGLTFKVLSSIFGSDDEPYDAELDFMNWLRGNFGEKAARVAAHGAPSMLGLNLSRRIGLSDVTAIPGTDSPEYLHGDGLAAYYASQLLGPSYSVPSGWFKAYDDIMNRGDIGRGMEAATPKPIRDVLKAFRVAHEGLKTRAGKKLLKDEDIGADDLFMMGLGFLPEDISQAQEKSRKTSAIGSKISSRRGRLIRDMVKDIENGDDTGDSVDAIRKFNKKMPAYAVTSGEIRSGWKARVRGEAGVPSRREALIRKDFGVE